MNLDSKRIIPFLCFIIITGNCVIAEELPNPIIIPDVIHYKEHNHWHKSPGFGINGNQESDAYSQTWIQNGKWKFQAEDDQNIAFLFETYDGNSHRWFHRANGRLFITADDKDIWISRASYITSPFLFLLDSRALAETRSGKSGGCTLKRLPGILQISNSDNWEKIISKLAFVGEKVVGDKKCILYILKLDPYADGETPFTLPSGDRMEIAFAPDEGGLPVQLRWLDKNGILLLSSEITKSQEISVNGKKMFFPTGVHIKKFYENGSLYQENTISITDLEVDKPIVDESVFTLDPTIAKKIVDEKNGVSFDVK